MAVLASDSFNRANSTTTMGNTDSYNGGTGYTWTTATTYGILSNQAQKQTGSASNNTGAWIDPSVSDFSVSMTIATLGNHARLAFRGVSDSSCWLVYANGTTNYQVRRRNVSDTVIATISVIPSNGDVIKATCNGSSITVTINGANSTTVTDTYNQTATKVGIITDDSVARFDNFQVEDLSAGTTQEGSSSVTGVSTITASATVIPAAITGSASLQGVAIVSATADVVNAPMLGSASLQGIGTATATASVIRSGSANIIGVSTLTASAAGLAVLGGASLTGVGWVMASAEAGTSRISKVHLYANQDTSAHLRASQETTVYLYASMSNSVVLEGDL